MDQSIRFTRSGDGTLIAYATSGAGPPLVKAANCLTHLEFDWRSPAWRHWLRELSERHTLDRFPLPGLSGRRGAPPRLDRAGTQVTAVWSDPSRCCSRCPPERPRARAG